MQRIVLSASRRTDIPAFYMPWFMNRIEAGHFEVDHPFGQAAASVPAGVEHVHSIVFWSKNFGPFLREGYGEHLSRKGYGLLFNFTLNSPHPVLEPQVPSLENRLEQLDRLCDTFGPHCVQWRFDPICFYSTATGGVGHNLDSFERIARRASSAGVRSCTTSFVDLYRKVSRRQASDGLTLFDPPLTEKIDRLIQMASFLKELNINLHLCCEKALLAALPSSTGIQGASCIPNHRLAAWFGNDISLRKDAGQRASAGCGCRLSRDIGSYRRHPCPHNCLFCYANPTDANMQSSDCEPTSTIKDGRS
jgi:hypothetical protein